MLNHKGTQKIYTERLILRQIREEDYIDMYRYTVKEEVARYVTWSVHQSIEDTKAVCKMWADEYKNGNKYHWAIVYDNRVIGNIEIVKIVDTTGFLGWQIDSEYWNKGIMTEAATAVRDYMFSQIGIEALEAEYMKENIGSGRVMQKIGMKEIPILESLSYQIRQKAEIDGIPIICYKLTKEEWE
ncbi:MAG: GNAT family N-acetyltransferase, partial [Eubacterium sp.]